MRWSGANATAVALEQLRLLHFVDISLPSGTAYVHTGTGTITVSGTDYLGAGALGEVSPIKEDADPFPRTVKLKLSGVDSTLVTAAMGEGMFNRAVVIRRGLLSIVTGALVATPVVLWRGLVNKCEIHVEEGGQTYIELSCESRLRRSARVAYYTKEDLQVAYGGDTFLSLITDIPLFTGNWGTRAVGPPVQYPPDFTIPDFYFPG